MRLAKHIIFWLLTIAFLTLVFGQPQGDFEASLLFVMFLLPAAMGTSYFFNYVLVPRFLLTKRYVRFGLYALYMLIFSIYLEMLALLLALVFLANYRYGDLNPYIRNLPLLTTTLYVIVFINAFILLIKRYQNKEHLVNQLHEEKERNAQEIITVKENRKNRPIALADIYFIESLADYVKIHTTDGPVITREKISALAKQLPTTFLRIHRSFLVNMAFVKSFNREFVQIQEEELPISRTYKQEAVERLEGAKVKE